MATLAPLATDPQYRRNPYQQFTGFGGLMQMGGGPLGQMALQMLGQEFTQGTSMIPMGLSEQNVHDRLQAIRLQKMHDEFLEEASAADKGTYFEALRGFSQMMGTPWGWQQMAAAENLSGLMAEAGPTAMQFLPPQMIDALGGMRGMNVVMAETMFQGGRFRLDPTTGKAGMGNDALTSLNKQVFNKMFGRQAWRKGSGLSAGETGQLFNEMSRMGMVGGGSRMEDMLMQMQGTPVGDMPGLRQRDRDAITDRAVEMGLDLGQGPGFDPRLIGKEPDLNLRNLSPSDVDGLKEDPAVSAALSNFDNRKAIKTLEGYGGVLKAMREIFGDAGYPNAPIPELINALNQLTGGALPQLQPGEIEDMARTTMNLASKTGLSLEATMMLSDAATQQAMEMGLPPIFANDALQHSLAYRGAFQQLGMGAHPAWGMSGQEAQMMKDMQLTNAAAGSRLANQMGAGLRLQDSLSDGDQNAFRSDSEAKAYLDAVRVGAASYEFDGKKKSLNMGQADFSRMLQEGALFDLDGATMQRFLGQESSNLEQVQKYGVADIVRNQQRGEFIDYITDEAEFSAQEAIENLDLAGMTTAAEQGLGHATASAAMDKLFKLTPAQRADRKTRNRIMATAVEKQLEEVASGRLIVYNADGDQIASRAQAQSLLDRFRADDNLREVMVEEMFGTAEEASRDQFSPFGPMSLQDALQQFDVQIANQTARGQASAAAQSMQQKAMAPLGRSGALRRSIQAVIDAKPGEDLVDVLATTMGIEKGQDIADALQATGTLDEVQARAKAYKAAADVYEKADSAEARATALEPLRAAQAAWQETSSAIGNAARRHGYRIGGAVDADDADRMIRATDEVNRIRREAEAEGEEIWVKDEDNIKKLDHALKIERTRQNDFVFGLYSDKGAMLKLGELGLTETKKITDAQAELDQLAVLNTSGDMGVLMRNIKPEGMTDDKWDEVRTDRNTARDTILRSQATLKSMMEGGDHDFGYLTKKEDLEAIRLNIVSHKKSKEAYQNLWDVGDMMGMVEDDVTALVEIGVIDQTEADKILAGMEEQKVFEEKLEQQKKDHYATGRDVLREGMVRMQAKPGDTEEDIRKRMESIKANEDVALDKYFGSKAIVKGMADTLNEVSPENQRRKHTFAELMRNEEELIKRAEATGEGAFDPEVGGDLTKVLEGLEVGDGEEEQEKEEFVLKGRMTLVDGDEEHETEVEAQIKRE